MVTRIPADASANSGSNAALPNVNHDRRRTEQEITGTALACHITTECCTGEFPIAELIVGYTGDYPVAQDQQNRVLPWLMVQISRANDAGLLTPNGSRRDMVNVNLEHELWLRRVCIQLVGLETSYTRDTLFDNLRVIEVTHIALRALGEFSSFNPVDPNTQVEIDSDDRVTTPSGYQFSISALAGYHNGRNCRMDIYDAAADLLLVERESETHRFLVNPIGTEFFQWCDVPSIVIASLRAKLPLNNLHPFHLVPPPGENGSLIVSCPDWPSLRAFYVWVEGQINQGRTDSEIYAQIDTKITARWVSSDERARITREIFMRPERRNLSAYHLFANRRRREAAARVRQLEQMGLNLPDWVGRDGYLPHGETGQFAANLRQLRGRVGIIAGHIVSLNLGDLLNNFRESSLNRLRSDASTPNIRSGMQGEQVLPPAPANVQDERLPAPPVDAPNNNNWLGRLGRNLGASFASYDFRMLLTVHC